MVNVFEALESKYVTVELVKESQTKQAIILEEGDYEQVEFEGELSKRLTIPVRIDGKKKMYRPNRDSISNLRGQWGVDTRQWVGHVIDFQIIKFQGKDSIRALPSIKKE